LGADADPGGGLITLFVLHQLEQLSGHLIRQFQFFFLADENWSWLSTCVGSLTKREESWRADGSSTTCSGGLCSSDESETRRVSSSTLVVG
jgi:hypothetical protein